MSNASCYSLGECTWGAAELATWIPCGLGNAINWVTNAREMGFTISMAPKVGSVVVYGPCCSNGYLYSSDGHCGVVIAVASAGSFTIREMNFFGDGGGYDKYDDRVSSLEAVLGFIYPPSVPVSPSPPAAPPTTPLVTSSSLLPALLVLMGGAVVAGYEAHTRPQLRYKFGQVTKEELQRAGGAIKKGEQKVVLWGKSF